MEAFSKERGFKIEREFVWHWSGVKIEAQRGSCSTDERNVIATIIVQYSAIADSIVQYGQSLPVEEQQRRQAMFEAWHKAVTFQDDFLLWISDKINPSQKDGFADRVAQYLRTKEGAAIQPDDLTDQVPKALRDEYAESRRAIVAWDHLVKNLNLVVGVSVQPQEGGIGYTVRVIEMNP